MSSDEKKNGFPFNSTEGRDLALEMTGEALNEERGAGGGVGGEGENGGGEVGGGAQNGADDLDDNPMIDMEDPSERRPIDLILGLDDNLAHSGNIFDHLDKNLEECDSEEFEDLDALNEKVNAEGVDGLGSGDAETPGGDGEGEKPMTPQEVSEVLN